MLGRGKTKRPLPVPEPEVPDRRNERRLRHPELHRHLPQRPLRMIEEPPDLPIGLRSVLPALFSKEGLDGGV
jgi:hypothetical protein